MGPRPILALDHATVLGGAERSLLLLLRHLDRTRWEPHLACPGGALAEGASELGVEVHLFDFPRLRRSASAPVDWIGGARELAGIARRCNAAALIGNTVRSSFYGALAARLAGVPFIWHMRDFWLGESAPKHLWADTLGKRFLCALSSLVVANSHATAAHIPCRGKVKVIHNGIEIVDFDPTMDGSQFRRRYGMPGGALLVGTVGRFRPWKGQDRFLRVFARVLGVAPDAWGVVVGGVLFGVEDGYEDRLRRLANDLDIADRVIFTGHLPDTRPALAAMDVFVHPGDPEPFGLVNLEAMAMAKPVVAFAHGALPEIVADGRTGVLVPPGDEEGMAEAIVRLLNDPSLSAAVGEAGRLRVEQGFTAERVATQIDQVYRLAVGT
ncbi:MAG: glycosyltransferase family 4 protein, partial [Anaerolineae bacterium]|nr:glycosyltransferase family 4 protein [Anaerolineae bacterium]